VDVSHANVREHIEVVEDTLAEIDVPSIPRILVWNKIDAWSGDDLPEGDNLESYCSQVRVSARDGVGIEDLLRVVEEGLAANLYDVKLLLPYERGEIVSYLYEMAHVLNRCHTDDGVVLDVRLPASLYLRFRDYQVVE
jgi:GTP-binding protein HflX